MLLCAYISNAALLLLNTHAIAVVKSVIRLRGGHELWVSHAVIITANVVLFKYCSILISYVHRPSCAKKTYGGLFSCDRALSNISVSVVLSEARKGSPKGRPDEISY
jgi:hypothetical protein